MRKGARDDMKNDSGILQDVIDRLNCGESPTRIVATRHNVMSVLETLIKEYQEMEEWLDKTDAPYCVGRS